MTITEAVDSLSVSLVKVCEANAEPCTILDLQQIGKADTQLFYCNTAFRRSSSLAHMNGLGKQTQDAIDGNAPEHEGYLAWITGQHDHAFCFQYAGFQWSSITAGTRWRLISGRKLDEVAEASRSSNTEILPPSGNDEVNNTALAAQMSTLAIKRQSLQPLSTFDWTSNNPPAEISPHARFIRNIDWSTTSLGPMSEWPPLLKSWCNLILAEGRPAGIFWGKDLLMIYNECFVEFAGEKHPKLMGQHPSIQFAEVWDHFEGVLEHCRQSGEEVKESDTCLFLERHGFPEECYVSFAFTPILDHDGTVAGNYHTVHETTKTIIAARRMNMLIKIGHSVATAQTLTQFWSHLLVALELNEADTPYAALYSVQQNDTPATLPNGIQEPANNDQCLLEWTIGLGGEGKSVPTRINFKKGLDGFAPIFRQAIEANGPINASTDHDIFQRDYFRNVEQRAFGDKNIKCIVCPLRPTKHESVVGFLVIGQNTRRPYDDDYKVFIELLSRQLATSLAATVLYEEEIRRGRSAAAQATLDRAELADTIKLRVADIKVKEERFTSLTQHAPVGVFIQNVAGDLLYRNKRLLELSGHSLEEIEEMSWNTSHPLAGVNTMTREWKKLLDQKSTVMFETKLDNLWTPPVQISESSEAEFVWTLTSAYPELSANGEVVNIIGFVTDISQQKWAEKVQQRKVIVALEAKRHQENFIDMTSHEIRNPLSAIMQCADGIITWLGDVKARRDPKGIDADVGSSIEAAQTIMSCCQHQKNIVDDILTLSKLNSGLLQVTTVRGDPVEVVQHGLKMFDVEMSSFKIKFNLHVKSSVQKLAARDLEFDPNRLSQVFVNLLSNAIKFTKYEDRREIKITIDVSTERPADEIRGVKYFPRKRKEITGDANAQKVFFAVSVTDTGCGLDETEQRLLFQRFSQASVLTHTKYGGSGLGLFICRELIDLQGGQIGVESQQNIGSTFKFFITAYRPEPRGVSPPWRANASSRIGSQSIPTPMQHTSDYTATVQDTRANARAYNVLIVEDNIVNQRVLAKQLRGQNHVVHIANHGEEAIKRIQKSSVWKGNSGQGLPLSTILMDIEMPVMDGLSCMKEIRRLQGTGEILEHIPIIATTANARKEQMDQALAAGADNVITKPFRVKDLVRQMESTIINVHESNRNA